MVAIKRHIQIDKRMRSSSRLKCSSNNFCSSASEVRKAMWSAFRALTSFAGILDFRKHPFDLAPCPSFRYPKDFDRAKYNNWLKLSGITGRQRIEDVLINIEALRRENIPEYPMKALREAITNAVMHRDWFIDGANVFVEIYIDRIEVVSRINFIEKAGTGIKRIRDEAREGGYPEPVWEANGFVTTVFRPNPEVQAASASRPGTGRDRVETKSAPDHPSSTRQVPPMYPPCTPQVMAVLAKAEGEATREEMQLAAELRDRKHFREEILRPLVQAGWNRRFRFAS